MVIDNIMKNILLKKKLEKKLEKIDREISIEKARNSEKLRKERVHRLIKLGALFEIANLLDFPETVLLGYLLDFSETKNDEKIEYWENLGSKELINRIHNREIKKQKKSSPKIIKEFTHKDILELLQKANEKKINIVSIAQKNFKKNLLENLSYKEFEFLKNILENCE